LHATKHFGSSHSRSRIAGWEGAAIDSLEDNVLARCWMHLLL
jgi:hypothetical protein